MTALVNTQAADIEKSLEQVRLEAPLEVKVRPCQARRPQGPGDFQKPMVEQLLSREVVLEVWASAVAVKDAGVLYNQTEIGYVLVPVRYYEFGAPRPPGAFVVTIRSRPLLAIDDLVRLLNQSGRLAAYAALASGQVVLRSAALKQTRWAPARGQLCRAASMLGAIRKPLPEDTQLAAYAQQLASEALAGARGDPAYVGSMKALPIPDRCPP
jgi:hypothetical protein